MLRDYIPSLATVPVLETIKLPAHHVFDAWRCNKLIRLAHDVGKGKPRLVAALDRRHGGFETVHVYAVKCLDHLQVYFLHSTCSRTDLKRAECLKDVLLHVDTPIPDEFAKANKL